MRKLIKFSCLVISTATFLIAQGSDNLLSNGDFETSSLTGWGFTPYNENPETDTAAATREIDSTSVR